MKKINNPLLNYEKKWVALTPDNKKVVASAKSADTLLKKVDRLKDKNVILLWVPPFDQVLSL